MDITDITYNNLPAPGASWQVLRIIAAGKRRSMSGSLQGLGQAAVGTAGRYLCSVRFGAGTEGDGLRIFRVCLSQLA
ncbi:MAG: hypothetical protein HC849_27745 [Oscillatoriales cyanobacterium RU_3_3]|nr:hypothetical protein [Oscillatoriales cyanobacterium RU_3_3]NJR21224.1 hypothetical protein [Richelia sp. CSU_2_1]NJS42146.1 hypothetical protein [Candidatus Gracilibacteria bacterium]